MHVTAVLAHDTLISVWKREVRGRTFRKGGRDELLRVMRLDSWMGEWHKGVEGVALVQRLVNVSLSPAHKLLKASLELFCLVLASVLSFVATRIGTSAFTSTGFMFYQMLFRHMQEPIDSDSGKELLF